MKQNGLNRRATSSLSSLMAVGLLFGIAAFATPASAQQGTINPEQACRDDAFRLCNEFIPDRDKVGACLRRKSRSLSRDCRTVVFGGGRGTTHRTSRRHHKS